MVKYFFSWTITPTGANGFEHGTYRLTASRAEFLVHWWGFCSNGLLPYTYLPYKIYRKIYPTHICIFTVKDLFAEKKSQLENIGLIAAFDQ